MGLEHVEITTKDWPKRTEGHLQPSTIDRYSVYPYRHSDEPGDNSDDELDAGAEGLSQQSGKRELYMDIENENRDDSMQMEAGGEDSLNFSERTVKAVERYGANMVGESLETGEWARFNVKTSAKEVQDVDTDLIKDATGEPILIISQSSMTVNLNERGGSGTKFRRQSQIKEEFKEAGLKAHDLNISQNENVNSFDKEDQFGFDSVNSQIKRNGQGAQLRDLNGGSSFQNSERSGRNGKLDQDIQVKRVSPVDRFIGSRVGNQEEGDSYQNSVGSNRHFSVKNDKSRSQSCVNSDRSCKSRDRQIQMTDNVSSSNRQVRGKIAGLSSYSKHHVKDDDSCGREDSEREELQFSDVEQEDKQFRQRSLKFAFNSLRENEDTGTLGPESRISSKEEHEDTNVGEAFEFRNKRHDEQFLLGESQKSITGNSHRNGLVESYAMQKGHEFDSNPEANLNQGNYEFERRESYADQPLGDNFRKVQVNVGRDSASNMTDMYNSQKEGYTQSYRGGNRFQLEDVEESISPVKKIKSSVLVRNEEQGNRNGLHPLRNRPVVIEEESINGNEKAHNRYINRGWTASDKDDQPLSFTRGRQDYSKRLSTLEETDTQMLNQEISKKRKTRPDMSEYHIGEALSSLKRVETKNLFPKKSNQDVDKDSAQDLNRDHQLSKTNYHQELETESLKSVKLSSRLKILFNKTESSGILKNAITLPGPIQRNNSKDQLPEGYGTIGGNTQEFNSGPYMQSLQFDKPFAFPSDKNLNSTHTLSKGSDRVYATTQVFRGSEYDTFGGYQLNSQSEDPNFQTRTDYNEDGFRDSYPGTLGAKAKTINKQSNVAFYEDDKDFVDQQTSVRFGAKLVCAPGFGIVEVDQSMDEPDQAPVMVAVPDEPDNRSFNHSRSRIEEVIEDEFGDMRDENGSGFKDNYDDDRLSVSDNLGPSREQGRRMSVGGELCYDSVDVLLKYSITCPGDKRSEYDISDIEANPKKSSPEIDSPRQRYTKTKSLTDHEEKMEDLLRSNPEYEHDTGRPSLNLEMMKRPSDGFYNPKDLFETERSLQLEIGMLKGKDSPVVIPADFTKSFLDGYMADNTVSITTDGLPANNTIQLQRFSGANNNVIDNLPLSLIPEEHNVMTQASQITMKAPAGYALVESDKSIKLQEVNIRDFRQHEADRSEQYTLNNYSFNLGVADSIDANILKLRSFKKSDETGKDSQNNISEIRNSRQSGRNEGWQGNYNPLDDLDVIEKEEFDDIPEYLMRRMPTSTFKKHPNAEAFIDDEEDVPTNPINHIKEQITHAEEKLAKQTKELRLNEQSKYELEVVSPLINTIAVQTDKGYLTLNRKDADSQTDLSITKYKPRFAPRALKTRNSATEVDSNNKNPHADSLNLESNSNLSHATRSHISHKTDISPVPTSRQIWPREPQNTNDIPSNVKIFYDGMPISQEEYDRIVKGSQVRVCSSKSPIRRLTSDQTIEEFSSHRRGDSSQFSIPELPKSYMPLKVPPVHMVESRFDFNGSEFSHDRKVMVASHVTMNFETQSAKMKASYWINTSFTPLQNSVTGLKTSDLQSRKSSIVSQQQDFSVQSRAMNRSLRGVSPIPVIITNDAKTGRNKSIIKLDDYHVDRNFGVDSVNRAYNWGQSHRIN